MLMLYSRTNNDSELMITLLIIDQLQATLKFNDTPKMDRLLIARLQNHVTIAENKNWIKTLVHVLLTLVITTSKQ